jgi:hypothetical protein
MSAPTANQFSAAGAALGYLAQVEYGLLLTLRRMDDTVDLRLSLETADDIVFETDGTDVRELWQSKHHVTAGSLGDASPDIWKSLNSWIVSSDENCAFVLFSTATAPAGSAASLLGKARTAQDVLDAHQRLEAIATAAGNKGNTAYYKRFLDLAPNDRIELLNRLTVLDQATRSTDLTDELISAVRKTVRENRRQALVERLRGWWHDRAIKHLNRIAAGEADWIEMAEVEGRLFHIAQSLSDENLPLDFSNIAKPTSEDVVEDNRIFVEQLRMIMLHHERVGLAVYDHNRAFLQRSRWQREDLLNPLELENYDRLLIEEWRRVFLPLEEGEDDQAGNEESARRAGLNRFHAIGERNLPEVRREIRSGYIPMGSLHMLADRMEIGWHPDWVNLLRHRIHEAGGLPAEPGVA